MRYKLFGRSGGNFIDTAFIYGNAFIRQQHRFGTIFPILGARTLAQIQDNMGCLSVTLSAEQWQRLEQATAPELGFPHDILQGPMLRDMLFGGEAGRLDNHHS